MAQLFKFIGGTKYRSLDYSGTRTTFLAHLEIFGNNDFVDFSERYYVKYEILAGWPPATHLSFLESKVAAKISGHRVNKKYENEKTFLIPYVD